MEKKRRVIERYLGTRKAARIKGCAWRTVENAVNRGDLPIVLVESDSGEKDGIGIRREDLDAWTPRAGPGRPPKK